jgi:hypothetical protein
MDQGVNLSVESGLQGSIQVGEKVVPPATALNPRPKRQVKSEVRVGDEQNPGDRTGGWR